MPATALPSLDEPNAGRLTIQYCPASDEKIVENPPRFMWIPVIDEEANYVLRISRDPDFPAKTTHIFANLPLNFFKIKCIWFWLNKHPLHDIFRR